ncbi:hypothetical protein HY844_02245 [Candidatus Berkelbacteria bacterium]|nr:hypothetical protein [Candidatus Berkelbacteria bacterium]
MMKKETREYISAVTKLGLLKRAQAGKHTCRLPLGYTKDADGNVIIDPIIGPKVKWLFQLRAAKLTLRQIQAASIGCGLRSGKGQFLQISTLSSILKNPFYSGFVRSGDILFAGNHPALH